MWSWLKVTAYTDYMDLAVCCPRKAVNLKSLTLGWKWSHIYVNPCSADDAIFHERQVSVVAVDVLAPCIARPFATILLTVQDELWNEGHEELSTSCKVKNVTFY